MKYFDRIKSGVTLHILVQVFSTLGLGFASYFFLTQDVALFKIIMVWAISPLTAIPVVLFFNKWDIKKHLKYGLLSYTGMALSLLFFNQYSFIIFGIFNGLTLGFFWVSLNYIFFRNSSNKYHAKDSSIYFILGPIFGMILPPLGALVISSFGFKILFLITGLLSIIPLLYIRVKDFDYHQNLNYKDAEKAFSGLRLITFFDGALHFFQGHFLAIYVLLFLKTEYEVGGLLSYLAIISLVISFLMAYISDKYKKRVEILYPLLLTMGVLILIIPTIDNLAYLIVAIGIYAFFDNLSLPIRFAIPMDLKQTDIGFWRVSELYGNLGRVTLFGLASLLIYNNNYWLPFVIFALMAFAFPFIIKWKISALRNRVPA